MVNTKVDKADFKLGDGICRAKTKTKAKAKASCTLRAAIQTANAKRGTFGRSVTSAYKEASSVPETTNPGVPAFAFVVS